MTKFDNKREKYYFTNLQEKYVICNLAYVTIKAQFHNENFYKIWLNSYIHVYATTC